MTVPFLRLKTEAQIDKETGQGKWWYRVGVHESYLRPALQLGGNSLRLQEYPHAVTRTKLFKLLF